MMQFRRLPGERILLYTPIGLSLVDQLTGRPPIGRIDAQLEFLSEANTWIPTDIQPRYTAGGALMYPNLGRTTDVDAPPREYRIVLDTEFYRPFYATLPVENENSGGLRFESFPFNDESPLETDEYAHAPDPRDEFRLLLPATNYPFPSHLRVVRGFVELTPEDAPATDATVDHGLQKDRAVTCEDGEFALPIRWLTTTTAASKDIESTDEEIEVNFVAGLGTYAAITIDGVPADGEPTVFEVEADVGATPNKLTLKTPVGTDRPADTPIRLTSFNLHVVHESTGRETTHPTDLKDAFTTRQTISLPAS